MKFVFGILIAALVIGLLSFNEFEAEVIAHQRATIIQLMTGSDCPLQRTQ